MSALSLRRSPRAFPMNGGCVLTSRNRTYPSPLRPQSGAGAGTEALSTRTTFKTGYFFSGAKRDTRFAHAPSVRIDTSGMACAPPPLPFSRSPLPPRQCLLLSNRSFQLPSSASIGNASTSRPHRRTAWRAFHSDRVLPSRRCPQVPPLAARSAAVHGGEASLALRASLAAGCCAHGGCAPARSPPPPPPPSPA